jgi:hypothetical protein
MTGNHWSDYPEALDGAQRAAQAIEVSSAQAAAAFTEADRMPEDEKARRVSESIGGAVLGLRNQVYGMAAESRQRVGELADATGCEASAERGYHQGRLEVAQVVLDALRGSPKPDSVDP